MDTTFAYGNIEKTAQDCVNVVQNANRVFHELRAKMRPRTTAVVVCYGGIGDAIHSRLLAQNLVKVGHTVAWITNPFVAGLYKDDPVMQVLPGFALRYRDPRPKWQHMLCGEIRKHAQLCFHGKKVLDVSCSVSLAYSKQRWSNYAKLFFNGAGIRQDPNVKHSLVHHGELSKLRPDLVGKKFILIEHASLTFGTVPVEHYRDFVARHAAQGIPSIYVGAKTDPEIPGALDGRGLSMYDTYTLAKNCHAMLAKASGNQSLMAFQPKKLVYEVDIPPAANMSVCGYHQNTKSITKEDLKTLQLW